MHAEPLTLTTLKTFMNSIEFDSLNPSEKHVIASSETGVNPSFCVSLNPTKYHIEINFYPKFSQRQYRSLAMKRSTTPSLMTKKLNLEYDSKTPISTLIDDYNILTGHIEEPYRTLRLVSDILDSLEEAILENTPIDKTISVFNDFTIHRKVIMDYFKRMIKNEFENPTDRVKTINFVNSYLTEKVFEESSFPIKSEITCSLTKTSMRTKKAA